MSLKSKTSTVSTVFPPEKIVGLVVNPIAGMGGTVGLKGTDGKAILKNAIALGAKPLAPVRTTTFLSELNSIASNIHLVVGAGLMGEQEAQSCGFKYTVVGEEKAETSSADTKEISAKIVAGKADLLVFCGGDGTARDIMDAADNKLPVLGVPTGVKMHSAVFAVDPKAAAQITSRFLSGELSLREAEVMDIDEEAFRTGRVSAELYGYLLVPYESHLIQEAKMASLITDSELRNQAAIAVYIIETMKPDTVYIIGPGTTTRTIGDLLDEKKTLLGVDVFINKRIVAHDVNETQIMQAIRRRSAQIVVTPIGGQGFLFGRGNQQISPRVIRRVGLENITVVATNSKMRSLKTLRTDTGDSQLDATFRARKLRIVTDYKAEYRAIVE
ncbi:TPA: ATP-NAD kinase family protein [Candidatus Bathyarchaeota archaeon]|nr:ATP-NAD kinase family protein [Candidatus Bathyarchaeota archaeon]